MYFRHVRVNMNFLFLPIEWIFLLISYARISTRFMLSMSGMGIPVALGPSFFHDERIDVKNHRATLSTLSSTRSWRWNKKPAPRRN